MHDNKVRKQLLRKPRLTLGKTNEIFQAAENMAVQMKMIGDESTIEICVFKEAEICKKHPN